MTSALLNDLNPVQQKAVLHTDGPVLILAGAGSGKTKVLTYRVAYLIADKHVPSDNILMLTFTNKAADQMRERITSILGTQNSGSATQAPYAGTFHSLCVKILKIDGQAIGIPNNFLIYDEDDQLELIKDIMKRLDISVKNINPNSVRATISEAKNELISPLEYPQYARGYFQETVAKLYIEYAKELKKNAALDFDDLLSKTVDLFQKQPDILGKYQEKFRYILIDEYQDTNRAQYLISRQLSQRYRNICVVGDASQSIYRWRGADFRNIVNFKKDFPDALEFHLEQNYRSTQIILDAAHGVISKNTSHPVLKLWTDNKAGKKITLYEARTEHDEAGYLTQMILQSKRPFTDFAVLYRTNAQSRVIEEAFIHAGIPYILVGGTRFYERKEIRDVLSYLRLLANPKDTVSFNRIQKLGKGRTQKFLEFAKAVSSDNRLVALTTLELLDQSLETTAYMELYNANVEEESYRLENIKELRSVATQYPNLSDFLHTVALVEQEYAPKGLSQKDAQRPAVTMMTLHSAKGLEFPIVVIVGMEEGIFPHSRSLMDREAIEEERRLCYVGITRAKEMLYMTYANRRLFFGSRTQNMISRFISDIPADVVQLQVSLDADRGFRSDDLLL